MKPLYEINNEYFKWLEKAQEAEGEIGQDLFIEFEHICNEFETKAEAYAVLIKQLNGEASILKAEEDRIAERRKKAEKTAETLKQRLAESMQFFDKDKFETPKCKVSFRTSTAVNILDEALLPKKFFKIVKTPSKADIKEALKSGLKVKGAELVENKNIQIK